MANRLTKIITLTYIPGVPLIVGREAYCVTKQILIGRVWKEAKRESFVVCPPYSIDLYIAGKPQHPCSVYTRVTPAGYQGVYRAETTCYPAVAARKGVPAKMVKSASNGWDAGARSIAEVKDGEYIQLTVRENPVAVIVGLTKRPLPYNYGGMKHAIVLRSEGVRSVVEGVDGSLFPAATAVRIERLAGNIKYYADGMLIHSAIDDASESLYCYVGLYSMGDYVENPKIGKIPLALGVSEFKIQSEFDRVPQGVSEFKIASNAIALGGSSFYINGSSRFTVSSDGLAHAVVICGGEAQLKVQSVATGVGAFNLLTTGADRVDKSTNIIYALGSLGAVGKASFTSFCSGSGFFPAPVINGQITRTEILPAEASGIFPTPFTAATALNGGVSSCTVKLPLVGKASDANYFGGIARTSTHCIIAGDVGTPYDGAIFWQEEVVAQDYFAFDGSVIFAFHEGIEVGSKLDIFLIVNLDVLDGVLVDDSISFNAMLELVIKEGLQVSPHAGVARHEAVQYAVNSITGALSRYSNFGFDGFAVSGGRTFAINRNGLYELVGDSDDGDSISASIDFGASDFGVAQGKRLSSVYAGITTDGETYIRVSGDHGESAYYKATPYGSEVRARTAKGIIARNWRVSLDIIDASRIDLDNLEVEIGVSQRRLSGRR